MKIKTEIKEDGSIVCETQIDNRHYRSRYKGYTLWQAKRRFIKRVIDGEQKELDRVRMEAIYMCLRCEKSAKECKGNCKYIKKQKPRRNRVL